MPHARAGDGTGDLDTVLASPYREIWIDPAQLELEGVVANDTFTVTDKANHRNVVRTSWIIL